MTLADAVDPVATFQLALDRAINAGRESLLAKQFADGYWRGELQGDSILESEYILIRFILDEENDPRVVKVANYLRNLQQPDGGWCMYPGGATEISGSVKAYFALKLMGDALDAPHMLRAKQRILECGGAEKCNTFTRFFLAALGQISFDACPSIPPEVVLLPKWFYFNLYNVSAWTRTMILPLGIVTTFRYTRKTPLMPEQRIDELYHDYAIANRLSPEPLVGFPATWKDLFLRIDQGIKWYEKAPIRPLREFALKEAEKWLLTHSDASEGLGAIFPSMVYMLVVFRILGYADDHPRVLAAHKHLDDFFIEEGDEIRIQPCLSPVWDTGIAMHALAETGLSPDSEPARRGVDWLLQKEVRTASDWQKNCPDVEPSGWFFEFENPHYPDTDDTAMACLSLHRLGGERAEAAVRRGVAWLLAMQNDDGGWAAFDRTTPRPILEYIPFADHNAMQDPSCPDIAGRILESLGFNGLTIADASVQRAIEFLKQQQDPAGCWWGRWGVNYVYGTWQVLCGLASVGENMSADYTQRAAAWLKSVQKPDGSFGETCDSYDDANLKDQGESTASQTAWGTMGMMAVFGANDAAVRRGVEWLINHQADHGGWDEDQFTGTGFPKVFYLRYHLYRHYFPLMAIGRYRRLMEQNHRP